MAVQATSFTRRGEFWGGIRATIPMIVGAIPFGIIFGASGVTAGLSVGAVIGLSLFVFAGSSQFIAVTLVSQGAGVAIIILTTLIVNLRHALYSTSLAYYMKHLSQRWLLPLGFWLTDETYATVVRRYPTQDGSPYKHWFHLGSSLAMYLNWQLCTLIGIVAGTQLKEIANWGLDFAMVVTFISIVVPLIRTRPLLVSAVVAGAVALLTLNLPNNIGLMLASFAGIGAGYFAEVRVFRDATVKKK